MADEKLPTAPTVPAMQAVRPAEKPTVPVDPPPAWAIDMFGRVFEKVDAGLSSVRAEVTELKTSTSRENTLTLNTVGAMRGELAAFGVRLGAVESTVYGGDGGSGVASLAKKASDHNLTQDAELANERAARVALAARVETIEGYVKKIYETVVGVTTNKKVLFVGKVIFTAAVAYSGLHGLKVLP